MSAKREVELIFTITPIKNSFNIKDSEAQASVPGASNKLGEWVSGVNDWVRDFSSWASSAPEAAKETKFSTKVA